MGVSRKERRGRKGSRKGPSVNTTAVSFKILIFLSLGFHLEPPQCCKVYIELSNSAAVEID